jgi:uncharacterized lipoprotein YmbA
MRGFWLFSGVMLLLAGCASPNPNLYTLAARPGTTRAAGPSLVVVRSVGIPRYMEREEIVRSDAADRLVVASNDWWGEPLSAMIRRVLAEDLALRLPASNVLAGEGVIGLQPDAEIEVTLARFDRDASGAITLAGFAAIQRKGAPQSLVRLAVTVPGSGATTGDEVNALSDALAQAADGVAQRLAE